MTQPDLLKRLRESADGFDHGGVCELQLSDYGSTFREAADTIEALTAERDRLREGLERLVDARSAMDGGSIAACRNIARAALNGEPS